MRRCTDGRTELSAGPVGTGWPSLALRIRNPRRLRGILDGVWRRHGFPGFRWLVIELSDVAIESESRLALPYRPNQALSLKVQTSPGAQPLQRAARDDHRMLLQEAHQYLNEIDFPLESEQSSLQRFIRHSCVSGGAL